MSSLDLLGNYITEYSIKNKDGADIPVYSVSNDKGFCRDYFSKDVSSKDKTSYKIVPRGCFAYNPSRINVGSIAWQDKEDAVIVSPLYVVFSTKGLNNDFLMYYLKSNALMSFIKIYSAGSVRNNLRFKTLSSFPVRVPSLEQQARIVAELDCLTGIIEKKKQQLKELDELAQSIFYDMFGDPIDNEKGWELKRLNELGNCTSGGTPPRHSPFYFSGNINWFSAGELNSLFLHNSVERITKEGLDNSSAKLCPAMSLFIGMYDTAAFKLGIPLVESASNQACANVSLFEDNVIWLYYTLMLMRDEALKDRHGARQKNLNLGYIKSFLVPHPPIDLQLSFAPKIDAIEKQKELIKKSIAETEALFNSRMDYWFN